MDQQLFITTVDMKLTNVFHGIPHVMQKWDCLKAYGYSFNTDTRLNLPKE